jgi:phage shock protein A
MSIFERIGKLIKAEMNDALDRAENPEKMVKLMVLEMEEAVRETSEAVAEANTQERHLSSQVEKYAQKRRQ